MTVSAKYDLKAEVAELLTLGLDNVVDPNVVHTLGTHIGSLSATSSPPATKVFSDQRTLSAGADSLDLTALVGANAQAIDFTGLKVQLVKIVAAVANTAAVVFKPAGANGYNLFGSATGEISLAGGDVALLLFIDNLPDVGAAAKALAITSADANAIYDIILVAG